MTKAHTLLTTLLLLLFSLNSNAACPTLKNDKIGCYCQNYDTRTFRSLGDKGIKIDQKYNVRKASCLVCKKNCGNTLNKAIKACKAHCKNENQKVFKAEGIKNKFSIFLLSYKQGKSGAKWHKHWDHLN